MPMRVFWMVAVALILGCSLAALALCMQDSEAGATECTTVKVPALAGLTMDATAIATFFLFFVTCGLFHVSRQAANAAKQSADVAAREFKLSRQPLVRVECRGYHVVDDDEVRIWGTIAEVAGFPTRLHRVETVGQSSFSPPIVLPPTVTEPNAILRGDGDVGTHNFGARIGVRRWNGDARFTVAVLCVDLAISVPHVDDTRQTWRLAGPLDYDGPNERYILPDLEVSRVDREQQQEGSYCHRIAEPVLQAWERFWNSVC